MFNFTLWLIIGIPSIIIASTIHEYAHALIADKLGDYTPRIYGRLSLNPLVHIDPIGIITMILFKVGWSKPVPINEYNFSNPEFGTALTALAGPTSNILTAIFVAVVNNHISLNSNNELFLLIGTFLQIFIIINVSLAIFNLIPIPPLDGSKIIRIFLPKKAKDILDQLERYSYLFILLLFIPVFSSPIINFITSGLNIILDILDRI